MDGGRLSVLDHHPFTGRLSANGRYAADWMDMPTRLPGGSRALCRDCDGLGAPRKDVSLS
jgi:hypothetical protein